MRLVTGRVSLGDNLIRNRGAIEKDGALEVPCPSRALARAAVAVLRAKIIVLPYPAH